MPGGGRDGVLRRRGRRAVARCCTCDGRAGDGAGLGHRRRGADPGRGGRRDEAAAAAVRADALRAGHRPRPVGRSTAPSARPAAGPDPAAQALAAPAPAAGAVRGAGLGDLRAADRRRAGSRRSSGGWCAATAPRSACGALRDVPVAADGRRASRPRSWRPAASRPGGRSRWSRPRGRWPRPGRPRRATSPPGGACDDPGIGPWTLECLALHGQGRDDQLPAGDLAYIKLVGAPGAAWAAARPRTRCASSSLPTRPIAGLAGTVPGPRAMAAQAR